MRYNTKFEAVETEGLNDFEDMEIEMSGKAFRSLIDAIYSRKIEAPVRELSTNALDAQIEAGVIRPFDVHLPNALAPTFYVRDYGISMTDEFVRQRYKRLFDSTKDGAKEADVAACDPNKTVGSWGLGSKSPFAYTDAITLTCWLDGEVRLYTVFIGDNGRPRVAPVFRGESAEPNGVKVEFAVKPDDIDDFKEAAIRTYKGFNILPNGLPTDVLREIQIEPEFVGSFFKCYSSSYLGSGYFARQGCVLYPIDLDKVGGNLTGFKGVAASVIIDFPIGSLEYTNSREFLAYTDDTVAALTKRFAEFRAEVTAEVTSSLQTIRNPFERARLVGSNDLFKLNRFAQASEAYRDRARIVDAFKEFLPYTRTNYPNRNHAECAIDTDGDKARCRRYTFVDEGFPDRVGLILIDEFNKFGTKKSVRSMSKRIASWLKQSGLKYAYVFSRLPTISALRAAGFPPITRLSAIPELPKPPREYVRGPGFARFKLGAAEVAEEDIPDNALFVFVNRGQWITPDFRAIFAKDPIRKAAKLLKRPIYSINVRSNDRLERWADYDMVYGITDDVMENLTDDEVRGVIDRMNYARFGSTRISGLVEELSQAGLIRNTVFKGLDRFWKRDKAARKKYPALFDFLGRAHEDDESPWLHTIIERGRALGCELLCPPVGRHGDIPYEPHLFPKGTEDFVNFYRRVGLSTTDLAYLVKEIAACRP
jgi:hypothetical protein